MRAVTSAGLVIRSRGWSTYRRKRIIWAASLIPLYCIPLLFCVYTIKTGNCWTLENCCRHSLWGCQQFIAAKYTWNMTVDNTLCEEFMKNVIHKNWTVNENIFSHKPFPGENVYLSLLSHVNIQFLHYILYVKERAVVCLCVYAITVLKELLLSSVGHNLTSSSFIKTCTKWRRGYTFFWQGCATSHTIEIIHRLPLKTLPVTRQYLCGSLIHLLHTGNGLPQTKHNLMCLGLKSTYKNTIVNAYLSMSQHVCNWIIWQMTAISTELKI